MAGGTSEIPLYRDLLLELVPRLKALGDPLSMELFGEASIVLVMADEASRLPKGTAERNTAYCRLIEVQRMVLTHLGL